MTTRPRRLVIPADDVRRFLASDAGVRLRRLIGAGVILTAPLLFRIPGLRRHPVFRWIEIAGGVALVVKLAEALRDWEPRDPRPIVLDLGPVRPDV
jgi:hypothetical protein